MMDNKSRHSFMFGDLATEVALDIKYRIGRAYRWAKKPHSLGRISCKNRKQLLLWEACYKIDMVTVSYCVKLQARS